jgi:hypothetical protein
MFYTIYKITNNINNKYYIGKHQTNDLNDGYFGSGKLIRRAIVKHGLDNFSKEILFVFDNEEEMNSKEAELVVVSEETYNLCEGGKGGFGHINRTGLNNKNQQENRSRKKRRNSLKKFYSIDENKKQRSKISIQMHELGLLNNSYFGSRGKDDELAIEKSRSFESIKKRKETFSVIKHQQGSKNSQFGTMWITNGSENKRIKKTDDIPNGWNRGRTY